MNVLRRHRLSIFTGEIRNYLRMWIITLHVVGYGHQDGVDFDYIKSKKPVAPDRPSFFLRPKWRAEWRNQRM